MFQQTLAGITIKAEADGLIRNCDMLFKGDKPADNKKIVADRLSNFLDIEIESMRELIFLDELWYKALDELRTKASGGDLASCVSEYVAALDKQESQ